MKAKENEENMESVKAELLLITNTFWQALADRDIEKRFLQCADTITFIGTGLDEKASGKAAYYAINKKGVEQYPEKFKLTILWERASVIEDIGWVENETQWAQMINGKEEKTLIRNTIVLKKTDGKWWIVHVHGSVPDFRLSGQNYITNAETIKINRELEREVYQRTKELNQKNRELEIESSLERVRAVAMGMHEPDDMLEVCQMISDQLKILGIGEIRNVQTAIVEGREDGHYMNYQYFPQYDKRIIEDVEIGKHPNVQAMISRMQQSQDAFFSHSFTGIALEEWKQYRKDDHQFSDPILDEANQVHFYFYSIGQGGLGLSTYTLLAENQIALFQRFRNVFTLAYQRFRDIEQAEAQAREAQIEASLERVRARSMAMQKSEELVEASNVLFSELHKLGIEAIRTGVGTVDSEKETIVVWSSQLIEKNEIKILGEVPRKAHPFFDAYYTAWKRKEPWLTYTMHGDEIKAYYWKMSALLSYPEKTEFNPTESFNIFFFPEGSLNVITDRTLTESECKLIQRFATVFGQIYRRFLDMQLAEAQAREAQIELALERVRARTMAMQRSDELSETAYILFQQFTALGESPLQITIGIVHEEEGYIEFRVTDWAGGGLQVNRGFNASIDEPTLIYKMFTAWKGQQKSLVIDLSGKELEDWVTFRNAISGVKVSSTDTKGRRVITCAFFSKGHISFSSSEPRPKETTQLLERFAGVFDQTYTRFLDLQKSEAQTKEAQIEAALERIRSRTMGMQKSEELREVIQVVYQQFNHLHILIEHTGFIMDYKARDDMHIWLADKYASPFEITIPYFDSPHWNSFVEAKEKGNDSFANLLAFEEKNKFYRDLFVLIPSLPDESKKSILDKPGLAISTVLLDNVGLYIENFQGIPYTDEENAVLMRFGKVFQQTYTRFLDLQKAEAQSKEARIEASLERVRAQAMAMHSSDDLAYTIDTFFTELKGLGVTPHRCGVGINDVETRTAAMIATTATHGNETKKVSGILKLTGHPVLDNIFEHWVKQEEYHPVLRGKEILDYYNVMNPQVDVTTFAQDETQFGYYFFFKEGGVFAWFDTAMDESILQIFRRFTTVLSLTHRRYMDLKEAEAQAREARIEAALEKVRSRTMAMQKSTELPEAANLLFQQLQALGMPAWSAGYTLWDTDKKAITLWMSSEGVIQLPFKAPLTEDPSFIHFLDAYQRGESLHVEEVGGEALAAHYTYMRTLPGVGEVLNKIIEAGFPLPTFQIFHAAYFSHGFLLFITYEPVPDAHDIFKRFATVFDQTYTRFLDLQKSEAQTREAKIEAGLERVRSRTMAMQSCDELAETASVVLYELVKLGIAPSRLYIAIIENDHRDVHFYLTNEDGGKDCSVYTAQIEKNSTIRKMYNGWADQLASISFSMEGDELSAYFDYLREEVGVPFKSAQIPPRRVQTIAYFSQGYIGIAAPDDQPEETTKLLERFAAVFNLTYTRFNDLKQAEKLAYQANLDLLRLKEEKARTEMALAELKAAQAQLIQSEKMASLGELTAGIAHEIQNPLNFVNNFSDVNTELIEEMKAELASGNTEEAIAIANDIFDNEQKINHHGKRADAIVKGMLQHSRTSSGVKEPTDINALADEYLRLAYHGLRAKDKSFNAIMKTDIDESIGKIDIIPQDIGRVILNLITNAFYAVNEKKKQQMEGYEPIVTVTTKKTDDRIMLSIKDNGNGIPPSIMDKIFQPFFTTKPTGQGTGLGLSLSYDIVKAHGGELLLETKEGEGTTFVIQLPIKS